MNLILNPLAAKAHPSHTMGLQWATAITTTSLSQHRAPALTAMSRSQHRAPDHTTTSSWACIEPQSQSSLAPQAQTSTMEQQGSLLLSTIFILQGIVFPQLVRDHLWSNWVRPTLCWLKKILRRSFCCLSSGDTTICWHRVRLSSECIIPKFHWRKKTYHH